jgi:DNA-binding NtrC family response regulator
MVQPQEVILTDQLTEIGDGEGRGVDGTLPRRSRSRSSNLDCPKGLVASSDEEVLRKLAKIMGECGLATLLAFTVSDSIRILERDNICLVLCEDHLIDGNYEGLLNAAENSKSKAPVIVFSSTGDWPDYFDAIRAGAFDYMAYPPFLGDVPRVIRHALASRMPSIIEGTTTRISNSSRGEIL